MPKDAFAAARLCRDDKPPPSTPRLGVSPVVRRKNVLKCCSVRQPTSSAIAVIFSSLSASNRRAAARRAASTSPRNDVPACRSCRCSERCEAPTAFAAATNVRLRFVLNSSRSVCNAAGTADLATTSTESSAAIAAASGRPSQVNASKASVKTPTGYVDVPSTS